jgi:hypothetical protein
MPKGLLQITSLLPALPAPGEESDSTAAPAELSLIALYKMLSTEFIATDICQTLLTAQLRIIT